MNIPPGQVGREHIFTHQGRCCSSWRWRPAAGAPAGWSGSRISEALCFFPTCSRSPFPLCCPEAGSFDQERTIVTTNSICKVPIPSLPTRNPEWWAGILSPPPRAGNGSLEQVKGHSQEEMSWDSNPGHWTPMTVFPLAHSSILEGLSRGTFKSSTPKEI